MKAKKINKTDILTDMKKITVSFSKAKAKLTADEVKKKYKKLPKAYRIMFVQHLEEVKVLTPLEVIFFNQYINE
jgi:hypothetical protein